jgi:hypothetical protein
MLSTTTNACTLNTMPHVPPYYHAKHTLSQHPRRTTDAKTLRRRFSNHTQSQKIPTAATVSQRPASD